MLKVFIVIPARMASTRLPNKPLIDIAGTSLIMRVYNQACKVRNATDVIVATDHEDIFNHVIENGGKAWMTHVNHPSGTDRIAEVARSLEADFYINVQGDEPLINPIQIETLIDKMIEKNLDIGTQCAPITDIDAIFNENVVKVVRNNNEMALYFSRQAIPAVRDKPYRLWSDETVYFRHIGIYGFKRNALLEIAALPPGKLENLEKLEQLRWMEHGYKVNCYETEFTSLGVDTEEDVALVLESIIKSQFEWK
ncbi:MAG: 3-deoxy-manno-octulosonate cytidylyltransferase [Saprospiraceae bacterium]